MHLGFGFVDEGISEERFFAYAKTMNEAADVARILGLFIAGEPAEDTLRKIAARFKQKAGDTQQCAHETIEAGGRVTAQCPEPADPESTCRNHAECGHVYCDGHAGEVESNDGVLFYRLKVNSDDEPTIPNAPATVLRIILCSECITETQLEYAEEL